MMSRRTLAIAAALALAVAACASDEASPSTVAPEPSSIPATSIVPETPATEPSTVAPEPSTIPETPVTEPTIAAPEPTLAPEPPVVPPTEVWSVTQVDAELPNADAFYQELNVMVLPDGRPRVIYGTGTSLRMATCVDLACTEVEVVEVLDTAPDLAVAGSAAMRGDGSPVIVAARGVVWCEDPDCGSVTTSVLPEMRYDRPWLVTSPDGRVGVFMLVATEVWAGSGPPGDYVVAFTYCDDPGCLDDPDGLTELRFVSADEFSFRGGAAGGFDSEGLPVALHWAIPRSADPSALAVVACEDTDCVTVGEPRTVAEGSTFSLRSPMAVPGGGLVLLYQTFVGGPDVEWQGVTTSITVCEHTTCSEVGATVELNPVEAGEFGTPFSGALGPDGLVRLVWTTVEGFELTTCDDAACSAFVTSDLVPHRAHQIGLVVAGDGATVVATADSRPPDEPNIVPGVWLLRCDDRQCLSPEPAS